MSGRRTHHPTKGNNEGENLEDKLGDKLGRRTHYPTKRNKPGDHGTSGDHPRWDKNIDIETRDKRRQDPRKGGHAI